MDPITPSSTHYFPAPPRLAASHSPSPPPSRRQHFTNQEQNPLLSDLSPSFTLKALQANHVERTEGKAGKSSMQACLASASSSERAWGVKAALAGKKVREWLSEVGEWVWPGFVQPLLEESTEPRVRHHQDGNINKGSPSETTRLNGSNLIGKQKVGTLSSKLVQEYDKRVQRIRDDMEKLEIEDLKDYVRNAHSRAGSRRSSLRDSKESFAFATDYDHLDDFTAVITATIVQALPTISRLETLLNVWFTRLIVLRQVPSFLADLDACRESMVSASIAIGAHDAQHTKRRPEISRTAFADIQAVLQDQIAELGRRLDGMLDLLEGSADTLPDAWIDGLDNIENQYSAWVVKAERLAVSKELKNGRLEKDFTQDHPDRLLDLDRPLDIPHTTSTLDIGAQFDEIRQRADSDYNLTGQSPLESIKWEKAVTDSSNKIFAGPLDRETFPHNEFLSQQDLSNKARPPTQVVNSVDGHALKGLSDEPETSSLPSRSSYRPSPLVLADSRTKTERPDSPDPGSDIFDSGSTTSNYSSSKSSPEIKSAVVAEYISSPGKVTSLAREPMTPLDISFRKPGQRAEEDEAGAQQWGIPLSPVSKNKPRNGGPGHVRNRSASLQSFEVVPKHEIRRIHVKRTGSYSSTFSLSDPENGQVQRGRVPISAPQRGESETSCTTTPLPASVNVKEGHSPAPGKKPAWRLDTPTIPSKQTLYHPPPPVSVKSTMPAQSSARDPHPPKQQLPYHSPPAVPPRPAHPAQSLDQEPEKAERRISYHLPPVVPPMPAHPAQSLDQEPEKAERRISYHLPPVVPARPDRPAQSLDQEPEKAERRISYHLPPVVPARPDRPAQRLDREPEKAEGRISYHLPPAVPSRPAHPAQTLDKELEKTERRVSYHAPPPVAPRVAHRFEQVSDLGPGSTPVEIRQTKMSDPTERYANGHDEKRPTTLGLAPSNVDDQLQKRISSILTELPTQIRLTPGPEPDAPEVTRFNSSNPRTPTTGSPAWRLRRTQTSTALPSMTLAPAQPKSFQSRSLTGEPDIKLYHLHQGGKAAPIKLFVRLVGEGGERVMVRIGGGWADLGEYLREYACHHGRRSVSDSPFDITGLPSSSPPTDNQSPRSRPGSRPDTPTSSLKQSPANRLVRQQTSPAIFDGPYTPQSDSPARSSPRLSWAGTTTDEVSPSLGLAGPKTKNVDISPRRQAWVDDMMEQARHGGAEKKGTGEGLVGDLGKVGNTRRVFFKSRKEG